MTPDEYQRAAARTICPQDVVMPRLYDLLGHPNAVQFLHGLLGMSAEAGELWTYVQKIGWYGKPATRAEIKAQVVLEIGDLLWYAAEALSALGYSMEEVMKVNISKLRARFPDKYTNFHAAEENRDRAAEEAVVPLAVSAEELRTAKLERLQMRYAGAGSPPVMPSVKTAFDPRPEDPDVIEE